MRVSVGGHLTWPWWRGVSWKWTVLPVLARPRRWVNGTSTPCSTGCLPVSRRAGAPGFGALQAPGCGLEGRAGRSATGRGGRDVHPGVVAEAPGLAGLLEAAERGVVAVDGQADRGAHRSAVLAVGGH